MNDKLKHTIQWSLYALIMFVVIGTLACLMVNIIAPTFLADLKII